MSETEDYSELVNLWQLRYRNFNREVSFSGSRIPAVLHHIWLTDPNSPKSISASHRGQLESVSNVLSADLYNKWEINLWTNDCVSVRSTSFSNLALNIRIRDINDIHLSSHTENTIYKLIYKEYWGMASDLLRYHIVYKFGGFYADLGAEFYRAPGLDLYKYDFIINQWSGWLVANNFFAAKPFHAIFNSTLEVAESNVEGFLNGSLDVDHVKIKDLTSSLTADPINEGFYKYLMWCADSLSCAHIVVPHSKFYNNKDLHFDEKNSENLQCYGGVESEVMESFGVCAADHLVIGQDSLEGETWY